MISPIKKENYKTINKFDRKINLNGGNNHNYISIINITNNAPFQKSEETNENINKNLYDENRIYTKKIKGIFNKKKFLEQNFLTEINKEKNENNINNKNKIK